MLHHAEAIKRAQELMTEVHKKINTGSIGLGVLGSPAWVLSAALAFKLLESEADQVAAEKTHQQLRTLEEMAQDIRDGGRFTGR